MTITSDMNAHMRALDPSEGHGEHEIGVTNLEEKCLLEYLMTYNLRIINMCFFTKKVSHLFTYHNGDRQTHIDYILLRRRDMKIVLHTKVILYESVES